jgi:hypothetical protein
LIVLLFLFISASAYAGHPLITDDALTQGKGRGQIEIGSQYAIEKQTSDNNVGTKTKTGQVTTTLTYGLVDSLDFIVGVPYQWGRFYVDNQFESHTEGVGDIALDFKWRFFEKDGWSLALKPGITLPSGSSENEIGTGKTTYHLYGIVTKEIEPWAFHLNLGYIRNENKIAQEKHIWHASMAAEFEVVKSVKIVSDVIIERNFTNGAETPLAYALGGLVYEITDKLSIDGGLKFGVTKPSADVTYLVGVTYKF